MDVRRYLEIVFDSINLITWWYTFFGSSFVVGNPFEYAFTAFSRSIDSWWISIILPRANTALSVATEFTSFLEFGSSINEIKSLTALSMYFKK